MSVCSCCCWLAISRSFEKVDSWNFLNSCDKSICSSRSKSTLGDWLVFSEGGCLLEWWISRCSCCEKVIPQTLQWNISGKLAVCSCSSWRDKTNLDAEENSHFQHLTLAWTVARFSLRLSWRDVLNGQSSQSKDTGELTGVCSSLIWFLRVDSCEVINEQVRQVNVFSFRRSTESLNPQCRVSMWCCSSLLLDGINWQIAQLSKGGGCETGLCLFRWVSNCLFSCIHWIHGINPLTKRKL